MLQAGIEAAKRVGGYTFSLNLGIGRESSLLNSDDPARLLSHNISREFRRIIGHDLPYGFILELAPDEPGFGRLHSHGVFVPGDANIEKIEQALIRAGGKIEAGGWAKKQLVVKPITDALGWADYITKAKRWKKARPRGRHHFLSRPLNQIARLDFEEFGLGEASSVRRVF